MSTSTAYRFALLALPLLILMSGCGWVRVVTPTPQFTPGRLVALPDQIQDEPVNLDFESVNDEGFPDDWQLVGSGVVATDEKVKTSGDRSLSMKRGRNGNLSQCTKADSYRGKRALLAGDLKADDARGYIRLRAVHASKRTYDAVGKERDRFAFWGNATDRTSRSISGDTWWARYRVVIDVPEDASLVCYTVSINGSGAIWADALSLGVQE